MNIDRRSFLKFLGIGAAAAAVMPIEELIDRLEFARSPTSSIIVPKQLGVSISDFGAAFVHYRKGVEETLRQVSLTRVLVKQETVWEGKMLSWGKPL